MLDYKYCNMYSVYKGKGSEYSTTGAIWLFSVFVLQFIMLHMCCQIGECVSKFARVLYFAALVPNGSHVLPIL